MPGRVQVAHGELVPAHVGAVPFDLREQGEALAEIPAIAHERRQQLARGAGIEVGPLKGGAPGSCRRTRVETDIEGGRDAVVDTGDKVGNGNPGPERLDDGAAEGPEYPRPATPPTSPNSLIFQALAPLTHPLQ